MPNMTLEVLKESVRGAVITPDDPQYDDARRVYNAMIDRRPRVIVRPVNDGDVMTAVRFAQDNGAPVAVRGGSHSVPGFGTADDAVVIDLSARRSVRVDPHTHHARAEGGATWGDFNAATYPFGLATTGGIISTTGIGVVTSFEYQLHSVKDIYGGPMFFELEHARDVLQFYREYIKDAPEEMGVFPAWQIAPPLPFIPEERHGEPFLALVGCWAGALEDGERAFQPFHDIAPVMAEFVGTMPYPALNSAFDALVPPGLQHYWKANFVRELTDEAVAAHLEHGPKLPTVNSTVHIYPINGACHRVAPNATAFGHRDATFATVIAGMWPDPAHNEDNTAWVRDYYSATSPHSEEGGYINFASADDQDRAPANYGQNYDRLLSIKREYDPDNLFRFNQNIVPA